MSRIKLLVEVTEDLKRLAQSMEELANAMAEDGKEPGAALENTGKEGSPGVVDIEGVRKILSDKWESGKRDEVGQLIRKYGGARLTDIDPAKYPEILKEAANL